MNNLYEAMKRADSGDAEAQYEVAKYILHEIELDQSDAEIVDRAMGFLRNAAMLGIIEGSAAAELGDQYYRGNHIPQDYQQAVMWYRAAAQKLNPLGYYGLGRCFYYGNGVKRHKAKAFDSFFKGAITGYRNNFIKLGDMFKEGEFVESDPEYAVELFQHVLDSELELYEEDSFYSDAYAQVCLRLGEVYLHGCGVKRDVEKANYYFEQAKEHSEGACCLSDESAALLQMMNDAPYHEEDCLSAVENVNEFGELSDDDFIALMKEKLPEYKYQYYPEKEIQELYEANPSVNEFDGLSFREIFDGVQNNNPESMYRMAMICIFGTANIPKNEILRDYGIYLFHQALLGGCKHPLCKLADIYSNGIDVSANYDIAQLFYVLSECDCANASLGAMYANGEKVKRNRLKAYVLFVKDLLQNPGEGRIANKNLTIVYPHLKRFEKDVVFIEFLLKKSKRT